MRENALLLSTLAVLTFSGAAANAAPVTDVSDPGAFSAPNASELAQVGALLDSVPVPPGSSNSALRGAETTTINNGLDAQAPSMIDEAQHNEVGIIPLPQTTHDCPSNTSVTITISQSTALMTALAGGASPGQGVGGSIIDSRNLTLGAAVTGALFRNTSSATVGVPENLPSRSHTATFGDLPFYTAFFGFDVSEQAQVGPSLVLVQASWEVSTPSITFEYDDAGCTLQTLPAPVPAINQAQLLLLSLLIVLAGMVTLRSAAKA